MINGIHSNSAYTAYGISTLAGSILSLCIGLLVLSRDPKSKPHFSFFLITLTGSLWMFHYAMINLVSTQAQAYTWLRLGYLLAVPYISPSVYLFTNHWTNSKRNDVLTKLGYGYAFIFSLVMFFWAENICGIKDHDLFRLNIYRDTLFGSVYFFLLLAFFYFYAIAAFLNIFRIWRKTPSPKERKQLGMFLIGFLVGYTGSVDFFVARGLLGIFPFGFISFSLFILIIAYTIIRHQFLEINVLVKKISLIFLIYSILFALLLPIVFPILNTTLNQSSDQIWRLLLLSLGIGTVLSLGPVIYAFLVHRSFWLRGNISTGLTHELKSPLASIQGALDIVLTELENPHMDKKKTLVYMRMIDENTNRLDRFVKNLLHVAKAEDDDISLTKACVDVSSLWRQAVDLARPQFDKKDLQVMLDLPESLEITADEQKLDQVFSNLLSNAIKYSDTGTITIAADKGASNVQFSVSDQGRGIPKKDLERVFERFYQVRESTKGAGIGLAIAKAWVEAHGGKIWAESEGEGKGTTMKFTLPLG